MLPALTAWAQRSKQSEINTINALDLVGSTPIDLDSFTRGMAMIEANFGTKYADEKLALLSERIVAAGWTKERFVMVVNWFIDTKKFPAWTIADWFDYKIELHNYGWACKMWQERTPIITWEISAGVFGYTETNIDLPFKRA